MTSTIRSVPTGATRVAAVIGSPVRHSLSPALHNAAFAATGLDWVYLAFEVAPGRAGDALQAMRVLGIEGLSVTMPHKAQVADTVDVCTPAAAALGAVNCVQSVDGRLVGHNTDGDGFVDSLREEAAFDPTGKQAVVLGAGGAARAVVVALAAAGAAEVVVVNRTVDRAVEAARLAGSVGRAGGLDAVPGADLVVNATSIGMSGTGGPTLPCPVEALRPGQVVADLVYQPLDTPLLQAARSQGAVAVNGVGMLLHQAARAFTIWTGVPAPIDAMRAAVADRFR